MALEGMAAFLMQAGVISLSGVLAPGPVTAATLVAGARDRHAGFWVSVGHFVVEFPLVLLVAFGLSDLFRQQGVQAGIGLAGGAILVFMGIQMLRSRPTDPRSAAASLKPHRPLVTGILLSAGNPYFLLWWATVGLKLTGEALTWGFVGVLAFTAVHWSCDLVWLEVLSLASHKGTQILGLRVQRAILIVCGSCMAFFGGKFLCDSAAALMR